MRAYISILPHELPSSFYDKKLNMRQYSYCRIISDEGLFQIKGDRILKYAIEDGSSWTINVGGTNFICDESECRYMGWRKIPFNHFTEVRSVKEYWRHPSFKKIVERDIDDKIIDLYFEAKDKENLEENINTFLFS